MFCGVISNFLGLHFCPLLSPIFISFVISLGMRLGPRICLQQSIPTTSMCLGRKAHPFRLPSKSTSSASPYTTKKVRIIYR